VYNNYDFTQKTTKSMEIGVEGMGAVERRGNDEEAVD